MYTLYLFPSIFIIFLDFPLGNHPVAQRRPRPQIRSRLELRVPDPARPGQTQSRGSPHSQRAHGAHAQRAQHAHSAAGIHSGEQSAGGAHSRTQSATGRNSDVIWVNIVK